MQLAQNTILITGGTSGIGLSFAKEFLKEGSKVIICGRRKDRLKEVKAENSDIIIKKCDIADAAERRKLFNWVKAEHPGVNVLMNNAGVQLKADLTKEVELGRIHSEIETNLVAPIHLASLFAGLLNTNDKPVIINISSGLAFAPLAFMPVYCATKAAIHSVTLSLRHQLRNTNVKVFEIIPPSVDTELGHDRRENKEESHGGLPIADFISEAMDALRNDVYEAPIGQSKGLHAKREELFDAMNRQ